MAQCLGRTLQSNVAFGTSERRTSKSSSLEADGSSLHGVRQWRPAAQALHVAVRHDNRYRQHTTRSAAISSIRYSRCLKFRLRSLLFAGYSTPLVMVRRTGYPVATCKAMTPHTSRSWERNRLVVQGDGALELREDESGLGVSEPVFSEQFRLALGHRP